MQDICKMDTSKVPSRFFPDSLNQLASKCIIDSEGTLDSLIQLQSQYDLVSELQSETKTYMDLPNTSNNQNIIDFLSVLDGLEKDSR